MSKPGLDPVSLTYTLLAAVGVVSAGTWIFSASMPPLVAGLLFIAVGVLFTRALSLKLSKERNAKSRRQGSFDQHGR